MTEDKRFKKNDSGFVCRNCKRTVPPLGYTSRNHCPYCLFSLHVDINPGDRKNTCGGLMEPVAAAPDPKRGYIIYHRCTKCGVIKKNKAAEGENGDDMDLIIALTARQVEVK